MIAPASQRHPPDVAKSFDDGFGDPLAQVFDISISIALGLFGINLTGWRHFLPRR
jgi:hypothetical protein